MNIQHQGFMVSFVWRGLAMVVAGCLTSGGALWAARVDWDGGTADTNTATGGSANTAINWTGDLVPGSGDDVYLNDVASGSEAARIVTVNSGLTWKSLTINQTTAPSTGANSNMLSLTAGTSLVLTGTAPISVSGSVNAIGVLDLGSGGMFVIKSPTAANTLTFAANTLLTGSGVISNSGWGCNIAINGAINGTITNNLTAATQNHRVILGSTAIVGGSPNWRIRGTGLAAGASANFDCQITNAVQWQATPRVELWNEATLIEALSSTASPDTNAHYKFSTLQFGSAEAYKGGFRLVNTRQNDGGVTGPKEALYAATFIQTRNDSSNGRVVIDLNGQDLYTDSLAAGFSPYQGWTLPGYTLQNAALNSISTIRPLATSIDGFAGGGFQVLNGATLELVGGSWSDTLYRRNTGNFPADTAAAPNVGNGNDSQITRGWDGASGIQMASFTHFLGSGSDAGGNSSTTAAGTSGKLRIVGGDYSTSGLILSPLDTTGTVDTLSLNPAYPDITLNTVTIRSGPIQVVTNVSTITGVMIAPGHRYRNGDGVVFNRISTLTSTGFAFDTLYYIVNTTATGFQLAATPGGSPIIPTFAGWSMTVMDVNGVQSSSTLPALIVAGQTMIVGNLILPVVSGADAGANTGGVPAPAFQPTLRVGGVRPVGVGVTTVDSGNDTLTLASGIVTNGQVIYLSGSAAPGGLTFGQAYFARDVAGSVFKVAVGPSDTNVDITSAGSNVTNVMVIATNAATLTVIGDLTLERRDVTSKIWWNGFNGTYVNITIAANGINGDGTTVTVTNTAPHGLLAGDTIVVAGGNAGFNGTFFVANSLSPTIFTYAAPGNGAGGATTATIVNTRKISANVAIQSNATVKVGGNVAIGGFGLPQNYLLTGTGVGIHPASQFILNGGLAVTQTVTIVPPVGNFHVGEGVNGVLTGTAARALLATNLVVAGILDVNGTSVITGAVVGAGIILTNGADLVIGTNASIVIAGTLSAGSGSEVDLSAGTLYVGALDLSGGGVIDFKSQVDVEGKLRVTGNVITQLQTAIDSGRIRQTRIPLTAVFNAAQNYTTTRLSVRGTRLEVF